MDNLKELFLMVLEAGRPRPGGEHGCVFGEGPVPCLQIVILSLCGKRQLWALLLVRRLITTTMHTALPFEGNSKFGNN